MNEANFANSSLKQLLIWYLEAGVDESIGHNPVNRLISGEDNHEIGNRKNQLQESKNQTITTNLDPTETTEDTTDCNQTMEQEKHVKSTQHTQALICLKKPLVPRERRLGITLTHKHPPLKNTMSSGLNCNN